MTHNNDDPAPVDGLFAKERRLRRGWLDSEILRLTQERDGWRAAYEAQQPSVARAEIERLKGECRGKDAEYEILRNGWDNASRMIGERDATIAQLTAALEACCDILEAIAYQDRIEGFAAAIEGRAAVRDAKVRPTFMDHADEALASLRDAKGGDNA